MITVFISGWFHVLHPRYIDVLERARDFGDHLVVGLYGDLSAHPLAGPAYPRASQEERAATLRALRCVNEVIIFDEPTPAHLIESLKPDVLIKSADASDDQVIGADIVWDRGGRVISLPLSPGCSTMASIRHIQDHEESWRRPEEVAPDRSNAETPLMWVLRRHGDCTGEGAGAHLTATAHV